MCGDDRGREIERRPHQMKRFQTYPSGVTRQSRSHTDNSDGRSVHSVINCPVINWTKARGRVFLIWWGSKWRWWGHRHELFGPWVLMVRWSSVTLLVTRTYYIYISYLFDIGMHDMRKSFFLFKCLELLVMKLQCNFTFASKKFFSSYICEIITGIT